MFPDRPRFRPEYREFIGDRRHFYLSGWGKWRTGEKKKIKIGNEINLSPTFPATKFCVFVSQE